MEALGIPRGSYVVKVNNRKVLDGVMESIGLGGDENAGRRLTVLRAIDKLDRLGVEGRETICLAKDAKTKAETSRRVPDSQLRTPICWLVFSLRQYSIIPVELLCPEKTLSLRR